MSGDSEFSRIFMSTIRVYSLSDKQRALECFASGMNARETYDRLHFSYVTLKNWYRLFRRNDVSWALSDDEQFVDRQIALELFKQGRGYKFVASHLDVPASRTKYWLHMFKNGRLGFFAEGSKRPKRYDSEFRKKVLQLFSESTESKKVFAHQMGISVGVLNIWLKEASEKEV